eukprot:UN0791
MLPTWVERVQDISPLHGKDNELFWTIGGLLVFVFVVWHLLVRNLGALLARLLTEMDRKFIGTDITIGSLKTGLGLSYLIEQRDVGFKVDLRDVIILNPYPYKGEYMVKARRVLLDVAVPIFRGERALTINRVHVSRLTGMIEYKSGRACCLSLASESNVESMLTFMQQGKPSEAPKEEDDEDKDPVPKEGRGVTCFIAVMFAGLAATLSVAAYLVYREWDGLVAHGSIWHKVLVVLGFCLLALLTFEIVLIAALALKVSSNIRKGMPVAVGQLDIADGQCNFYSSGLTFELSDIHYDNFSEQVGSYYADDITWTIVQSVAKSILGAVAGSNVAQRAM